MSEAARSDQNMARARAAFEKVSHEIASVPEELVLKINLDVPTVIGTVAASLPELRALRPEIEESLPKHDLTKFDKLEEYALALLYAHGAYLVATAPPRSLEELGNQAGALRKILFADALSQAARGIFPEDRVEELRAGTGYRDLAEDLIALVHLYRGQWDAVKETTGVKPHELERAEALASQLVFGAGERERAPLTRSAAIDQRERAYALLVDTYNDARRAVAYLRPKAGEAETIAPSLFAGRMGKKGPAEAEAPPPPAPPSPAASSSPNTPETEADLPAIKVGYRGAKAFTE